MGCLFDCWVDCLLVALVFVVWVVEFAVMLVCVLFGVYGVGLLVGVVCGCLGGFGLGDLVVYRLFGLYLFCCF